MCRDGEAGESERKGVRTADRATERWTKEGKWLSWGGKPEKDSKSSLFVLLTEHFKVVVGY